MATRVLDNVKFYIDEYDLSSTVNQHALTLTQDAVENTTFGAGARTFLPGLQTVTHSHNGFFEAAATADGPDDVLAALTGSALVTVAPATGAAGEIAYSSASVKTDRAVVEGTVGDMAAFSYSGQGTGQHYRGTILLDALSARTTTGTGSAVQEGAITASEIGYATLHVVAASGTTPTLDVVVESDDSSGMATPTTRITFTQATGVTSERLTVAGAVTDDWWRISYTIGGTSPSFTFIVTFGIV